MGNLIWLASYPKSGNTWLRAFIHNYASGASRPHSINDMLEFTVGESGTELYRCYNNNPPAEYTPIDVQRMRPQVHRDLTARREGHVFVKTHNAKVAVEGVPMITPDVTDAGVYLVRDPRDIAVSYSKFLDRSVDDTIHYMESANAALAGSAEKVFEWLGSWSSHVESWTALSDPRILVLRYEDLLQNPLTGFGSVVRFFGAEPDPQRLAAAVGFSSFESLRQQEDKDGFIERPDGSPSRFFRVGAMGQWRDSLTPVQIERIEAVHRTQMQRFGYL